VPRPPDPDAKVSRIILDGKPEEEEEIKAFKQICARNQIQMREVMMKAVRKFLQKHNWPPGNSQTVLEVFGAKKLMECWSCHQMVEHLNLVEFISGITKPVCKKCEDYSRAHRTFVRVMKRL